MAITFSVVMAKAALTEGRLGVFVLLGVSLLHLLQKTSHSPGFSAIVSI